MYGSDEQAVMVKGDIIPSWEYFWDVVLGAEDHRPSYFNRMNAAKERMDTYSEFLREYGEDPANVKIYARQARERVRASEDIGRDIFLPALMLPSNLAMIAYWYAMAAIRSLDYDFYADAVNYYNKAVDVYDEKGLNYQNATETTEYYDQAISKMKKWREEHPELADTTTKSLFMLLKLADRTEAQEYANMSAKWHVGGGEILGGAASQTLETVKKPFVVAGSLVTGNKPPFLSDSQWLMARITLYSVAGIYVYPLVGIFLG